MGTVQMSARLATGHDAEAILEIYNNEVLNGTATFDLVPRTHQFRMKRLENLDLKFIYLESLSEQSVSLKSRMSK